MRLVRMGDLCKQLGIPRRTFNDWVQADPALAVWAPGGRGGGCYWIKVDRLSRDYGLDLTEALVLENTRWVRASVLAKVYGITRSTMKRWCHDRPDFARRIGRNYYVDLERFGAAREDVEKLLSDLGRVPSHRKAGST